MPKKYSGPGIDVFYEPRLCIHAARCVSGLPQVFDPAKRPWIQPMSATADQLEEVVLRCPSGALHTSRPEVPPAVVSVTTVGKGPLYVHGDLELTLDDGTLVRRDTRLALCRCGQSQNKPFCDNSHVTAEFEG